MALLERERKAKECKEEERCGNEKTTVLKYHH